jgi:LysR family hydrogen peroxide-inducible transcriptional activator
VLLGESSSLGLQTRRFFGDRKINVEIVCRCAQVATVKTLVSSGLGIAILPKMAADRNPLDLVYRELADAKPTRELTLARHAERFHSKTEEAFAALVREFCAARRASMERSGAADGAPSVPASPAQSDTS